MKSLLFRKLWLIVIAYTIWYNEKSFHPLEWISLFFSTCWFQAKYLISIDFPFFNIFFFSFLSERTVKDAVNQNIWEKTCEKLSFVRFLGIKFQVKHCYIPFSQCRQKYVSLFQWKQTIFLIWVVHMNICRCYLFDWWNDMQTNRWECLKFLVLFVFLEYCSDNSSWSW